MKNNTEQINSSLWGRISIGLATIGILFIVNFFSEIIPNSYQGGQVMVAFTAGILGSVFGCIGLIKYHEKTSLFGVMLNLFLVMFPFLFLYFGTLILGP